MISLVKKYWGLGVIIIFHLFFNLIWLNLDKTPPAWDQAAHIKNAIIWQKGLSGDVNLSWENLIRVSGGYPPLIVFLGGVWSMMVGVGVMQISLLNTLFLIAGVVGVCVLAKECLKNDKLAILAAAVFSLLPVIYDISRNFLLDLPLLVWVVWGLWSFVKSKNFLNSKYSSLFLLFLVLASLTKLNGFIYFIPVILFSIWQAIKLKEMDIIRNLTIMGLVYGMCVGWWWVVNFKNILEYLTGLAGQGEVATDPMNLLSFWTWIHYFKLFFLHQASPIVATIFLVALGFFRDIRISKYNKLLILFFLVGNYVIFTIIKNKDFRFTLPLLPLTAIILVAGISEVKSKWISKIILGVLGVYLMFNFLSNSFEWPVKKEYRLSVKTFLFDWVDVVNVSDYPVRSVKKAIWPQTEILKDVSDKSKMLVLINREEINDNNLGLYAELQNKKIDLGSVGARSKFEDNNQIEKLMGNFDYVLVPDKTYEPAPFYGINLEAYKQARDFMLDQNTNFELIKTYGVFDDKNLFLYRKIGEL